MGSLLKQYGWALNLLFILLLGYFLAKIANVYIAGLLEVSRSIGVVSTAGPAATPGVTRDVGDYEVVVSRNIFDSSETAAGEAAGGEELGPISPTGEPVKTALGIKVIAVMVVGEGKDPRSSATVDGGGGSIDVYAVGDEKKTFAPGVRLVQVKPTRIEFYRAGRFEYADLEEGLSASIFGQPKDTATVATPSAPRPTAPAGEKVAKVGENKFTIDQAEIDAALTNLDKLYTEIRAVPNFQEGKVQGMKILSIKPGSIFAKLGLKRGDVLARINGVELDIKKGFDLFNQLKDQKAFNLDLQRDGKNQTLEYEIR
ncbi:MAG: hypothetical protein HYV03_09115 [Deltaproteobacteria bacterium]|nr:hypothetical protein [Deltaproteobacteria bacterium]